VNCKLEVEYMQSQHEPKRTFRLLPPANYTHSKSPGRLVVGPSPEQRKSTAALRRMRLSLHAGATSPPPCCTQLGLQHFFTTAHPKLAAPASKWCGSFHRSLLVFTCATLNLIFSIVQPSVATDCCGTHALR
jgi:hypothetical protein